MKFYIEVDPTFYQVLIDRLSNLPFGFVANIELCDHVFLVYPSRAMDKIESFLKTHPQHKEKVILCTDTLIPQIKLPQIKPHEWRVESVCDRIIGEMGILDPKQTFGLGYSAVMTALDERVKKFANQQELVLILGETGTGKSMLGEYLHGQGRKSGAFGHVNVSSLGERLIPELFGHKKGAYTGADKDREGLLLAAKGGSFMFDEIGDLSMEQQGRVLDVVDNGRVMPLGQGSYVTISSRLIFTTWRNLEEMVANGQFRQDLYYRLDQLVLRIPPLRERRSDILPLAHEFLSSLNTKAGKNYTVSNSLKDRLFAYTWPGNVRELQHAIAKAFAVSDSDFAEQEIFDQLRPVALAQPVSRLEIDPMSKTWDEANQLLKLEYFQKLLEVIPSKTEAAKQAQMSKARFYEICKELGL